MDEDKKEELARRRHAKFRSDQYAKLQERKSMLRECQFSKAFLKAAVLIDTEKNFLRKKGIRGSQQFLEEYKKQRSQSLVPQSTGTESASSVERGKSLESKNPPNPASTSTSVSYTSNIDLSAKPIYNIGGSLPSSNSHTPLQKTDTALPRISFVQTPLSKHTNTRLNLTDTSFINKGIPLLTSTPIASPTKPPFGPSTSTSTDSGKFSLQGDKSDVDIPKKSETVTTPTVPNQTSGGNIFRNAKDPGTAANSQFKSPQVVQNTLPNTQPASSIFFGSTSTPQTSQIPSVKPQSTEQQPSLFNKPTGAQPSQAFLFKPQGAPDVNQTPSAKPQSTEQQPLFGKPTDTQPSQTSLFKPQSSETSTPLFTQPSGAQPFSFKPQNPDQSSSTFVKPSGVQSTQPFLFKLATDGKPLFPATTGTSTSSSVSTPGSGFSLPAMANALPDFSHPTEKPIFSFKPTTPAGQSETTKDEKSQVSQCPESARTDQSQQQSSLPNAVKWIMLMNKNYHQFKTKISNFLNDDKRKDLRKKIRLGSNDFIDRNLQLYENNNETNAVFGNFMFNLKKIVEGQTIDLEEKFSIDVKNEEEKIFFMECLTKRILDMIKMDKLLIPNAVILHRIIANELDGFAEYFRSHVASHNYIMQLTVDLFVKQLSKSLKTINDPDDRYRYILHSRIEEKHVLKLFVCIEKEKSVHAKKLSELAGQQLLWYFCEAYNELPQVPIASLTGMMVLIKNAQDVFNIPSSIHYKQFAPMMMTRLQAFLKEDVSETLEDIIKKLNCEGLRSEIKQCHRCAVESAEQDLKAIKEK